MSSTYIGVKTDTVKFVDSEETGLLHSATVEKASDTHFKKYTRKYILVASALLVAVALAAFVVTIPDVVPSKDMLVSEKAPGECKNNDDCTGDWVCLETQRIGFPIPNRCYECLNADLCPYGMGCQISREGASCGANEVIEVPSLETFEFGYNIYKADPLFTLGEKIDPGEAKEPFYKQQFDPSSDFHLTLDEKQFSRPVGIHVKGESTCVGSAKIQSITSTHNYEKEIDAQITSGGSVSDEGVTVGGEVGFSSYKKIEKDASGSITTIESLNFCSLYSFKVPDLEQIAGNLLPAAQQRLDSLKTSHDWFLFFDDYGTHIITEGLVGAFEKILIRMTEFQRSEMTSSGKTIEHSIKVGFPEVFSSEMSSSLSTSSEDYKKLEAQTTTVSRITGGHTDELLKSPMSLSKTVAPICDFVKKSQSGVCRASLTKYCINELKKAGLSLKSPSSKCKIQELDTFGTFDCVIEADCSSGQKCRQNKCVKCSTCNADVWTECGQNHSTYCPSGYTFVKHENCFLSTHNLCRRSYECNCK